MVSWLANLRNGLGTRRVRQLDHRRLKYRLQQKKKDEKRYLDVEIIYLGYSLVGCAKLIKQSSQQFDILNMEFRGEMAHRLATKEDSVVQDTDTILH